MNTIALTYICRFCHQPGVVPFMPTGDADFDRVLRKIAGQQVVHDECQDKEIALIEARRWTAIDEANAANWETLCPAEFRKPIKFGKGGGNRKFFNRIYSWRGLSGLWVHGPPGMCKTRFVWASLKKAFDANVKIFAISHSHFRQRITGLMASEQFEAVRWMYKLTTVELLFIDDFGKGNTTPASEEAMFDLLNARYENNRVTVFTSEYTRADAAARFSAERAASIQRRLEEMSEAVSTEEF